MILNLIAKWCLNIWAIRSKRDALASLYLLTSVLWSGQVVGADTVSLRQWVGNYRTGANLLSLKEDGQFVLEKTCFISGDATGRSEFRGMARFDGTSLSLEFNGPATQRLRCPPREAKVIGNSDTGSPLRLAAAAVDGGRFLLDEDMLVAVVNEMNGAGTAWVTSSRPLERFEHREPWNSMRTISGRDLLPEQYRKLLLPKPVAGRVTNVADAASEQINVGGWMRESLSATQYRARVTIDLGEADGVFEQMRLYIGPKKQAVVVDRVFADRCEVEMRWRTDEPTAGTLVTSTFSKK